MAASLAIDFHSQIASIMEVLANAAVAEICKVVDDGYAVVQLEMSRSQKENEFLRRKIKLLELQISRYRAERLRGAEGSTGGRFPGVRLLHRQSRAPLAGSSLQGRTRFLNRGPGAQQSVQKTQPINLDQDPDQEVVTTTKTESAEPEDDGGLLIVKVEGATGSTNHEAIADIRGDADPATSLPASMMDSSDSRPARCRSLTEGQGHLTNPSSLQSKEGQKDEGSPGGAAEGHIPCQMLPDWQETTKAGDMERPSCSTNTQEIGAANSSCSQTRTKPTFGFPVVSERPRCDTDRVSRASKLQIIVVRSHAYAAQDSCSSALSAGYGGDDVEEVSPLTCQGITAVRSRWQPLRCVQMQEPAADMTLGGNATHSNRISVFSSPAVTVGMVNSQQQQAQNSQSGVQQGGDGHISRQNRCYPAPRSQNQEFGLTQQQHQEPGLPYVCAFCSRRYAHQCQLRIHERSHTGEKPYQCTQCGKSFGQICSLRRHQMVHTGERPFPCPHCGKQFSTSTNLKVHQSVHTGEKKFHCSKCGKNFSFLSNLIRHQALHADK